MHGPRDYLAGLAHLHELDDPEKKRAVWRQGLASLAMAASNQRPMPLEGLPPEALLASVRAALGAGLVDDLEWLSKGLAGAALFEIAAALPHSDVKRELGRRVLAALHTGDASTFVLLATALASSSRRAVAAPAVRSRVGLALRLPIGIGTGVDRLALTMLCRPEIEREWLTGQAIAPLRARRIGARLLERAAREASRRVLEGDDTGLRAFRRPTVQGALSRLLADRESLVWRHAATARGLLTAADPALYEEIERSLQPRLGPTEWRRGVTSLAASIAHDPAPRLARCQELLESVLFTRDRGLGAAMLFGLSRAATEEPEAVEELLPSIVESGDIEVLEALVDLIREHPGRRFGARAMTSALARLREAPSTSDDGLLSLRRAIDAELSPLGDARRPSLHMHIEAGLLAFVEGRELRPHAEAALVAADLALHQLERTGESTPEERQRAFQARRELDRGLLESSLIADLLLAGGHDPSSSAPGELGDIYGRLEAWLLAREHPGRAAENVETHATYYRRRLRTLLHFVDGWGPAPEGEEGPHPWRERRVRTLHLLLARVAQDPPLPLRRIACAALARACESLVRDEISELSDVLVAVASRVGRATDLDVLAEAALGPEHKDLFGALALVARRFALPEPLAQGARASSIASLEALADALPPGRSPRVEALRRALAGLARAIERLAQAPALATLGEGQQGGVIESLDECVRSIAALTAGAWRRLGHPDEQDGGHLAGAALKTLDAEITRGAQGERAGLDSAIIDAAEAIRGNIPTLLAEAVAAALLRLAVLPAEAPHRSEGAASMTAAAHLLRLPPWLPPSRILGGFYVLRPIGSGTAGSVFIARRVEERHDDEAELFALKVPLYDGSVALTLSEDEFLRLFREEAGALLGLPFHPNLAGFVTFDARARPKPILVMELVQGPTLERALERRALSVPQVLGILDGLASGLEAMHAAGVGHLDVKPGNIILRAQGHGDAGHDHPIGDATAVLVDFGLAGRKVRPGCASPYYGAPEVWDTQGLGPKAEPAPADVYSFCCIAYELLAGRTLFAADSLTALIQAHFAHDGMPPGLERWKSEPRLAPLADVLSMGLVSDPKRRPPIAELRAALGWIAPDLLAERWPVAA